MTRRPLAPWVLPAAVGGVGLLVVVLLGVSVGLVMVTRGRRIPLEVTGLSSAQASMASLILEHAHEAGLPASIGAAMVVNAYAESLLDPDAIGDNGASVGLFQLHENGAGKGLSVAQRQDPHTNTATIIAELMRDGAPVFEALELGEDMPRLAALFSTYVERPANQPHEERRRADLARKLFPTTQAVSANRLAFA